MSYRPPYADHQCPSDHHGPNMHRLPVSLRSPWNEHTPITYVLHITMDQSYPDHLSFRSPWTNQPRAPMSFRSPWSEHTYTDHVALQISMDQTYTDHRFPTDQQGHTPQRVSSICRDLICPIFSTLFSFSPLRDFCLECKTREEGFSRSSPLTAVYPRESRAVPVSIHRGHT